MNIPFGCAALSALVLTTSVASAEPSWIMRANESTLEFVIDIGGATVTGGFSDWTVTTLFDPAQPKTASLRVEIAMASVYVDDPRAQAIGNSTWLAVGDYPIAVFEAEGFDWAPDTGALTVHGGLALRDITQPLTLTGTLKANNGRGEAQITATIPRLRYDIGVGQEAVGTNVQLHGHFVATLQD
jgi:polyisoprenoid-binding protein YceI